MRKPYKTLERLRYGHKALKRNSLAEFPCGVLYGRKTGKRSYLETI